jgi:hypothetical protein
MRARRFVNSTLPRYIWSRVTPKVPNVNWSPMSAVRKKSQSIGDRIPPLNAASLRDVYGCRVRHG